MARITHPRPQIGTVVDRLGGVIFRDGFAEVDLTDKPNLTAAYKQHGYGIEEDAQRPAKRSKRSRKGTAKPSENVDEAASDAPAETESGFAIVELSDGTIIGDGESVATLPLDERTAAPTED